MTRTVDIDTFVEWFRSNGGVIDTQAMGITEFPGSGRGAIALCDIPEGYTLFTLPRTITLSTRTSPLPALFGFGAWRAHRLHKGWVGLILCLMWEDAWAHELIGGDGLGHRPQHNVHMRWGPYMHILPTTFDTPMFWNAEELEELRGTSVVDKIGREDAEHAFSEQLVPAIKTSSTLFPPSHYDKWYSLDAYHRAGSRILSRSFTVSRWVGDEDVEADNNREDGAEHSGVHEGEDLYPSAPKDSAMHVNDAHSPLSTNEVSGSDSEDDEEDPSDVAMVPMADILNARWGNENAKLFYGQSMLRMVTTRRIKQGEQIFNTYGDPPNSDLLRRYGHVDLVRLHSSSPPMLDRLADVEMTDGDAGIKTILHLGNPSDVVEVRADLVVHVVQLTHSGSNMEDIHARIEWWLDECEDDTFVLSLPSSGTDGSAIFPPALVSLTRLLVLSGPDFESARSKGKLPKGNLRKGDDKDNKKVLKILDEVFKQRQGTYAGGSVEDDEHLLSPPLEALTARKRHAVVVRLGEKRILKEARQTLMTMLADVGGTCGAGHGNEEGGKREGEGAKNGIGEKGTGRKRVTNRAGGDREQKKARK